MSMRDYMQLTLHTFFLTYKPRQHEDLDTKHTYSKK